MMTATSTPHSNRYHPVSIGLHWLMLLLLAAVYVLMEFRDIYPRGSEPRDLMKTWHYMLGLSVLSLVVIRLLARKIWAAPDPITSSPSWTIPLAKWVHIGLYVLMIGMPIGGWIILSAEGEIIPFFGWQLPALIAPNEMLAEQVEEIHELGSRVGYALIGLHAVGALVHHYLWRDSTFKRMWFGR